MNASRTLAPSPARTWLSGALSITVIAALAIGCDLPDPGTTASGSDSGAPSSGDPSESESSASDSSAATDSDHPDDRTETEETGDATSTGEPSDTPPQVAVTTPATDLLGDDGAVYDGFDDRQWVLSFRSSLSVRLGYCEVARDVEHWLH